MDDDDAENEMDREESRATRSTTKKMQKDKISNTK